MPVANTSFFLVERAPARRGDRVLDELAGRWGLPEQAIVAPLSALGGGLIAHRLLRDLVRRARWGTNDSRADHCAAAGGGNEQEIASRHPRTVAGFLFRHRQLLSMIHWRSGTVVVQPVAESGLSVMTRRRRCRPGFLASATRSRPADRMN